MDRKPSARDMRKKCSDTIKTMSESRTQSNQHLLGFNGRLACKKSFISAKNKKKIMQWAREMKSKTITYWKNVVFTDESKIKIIGSDDRVFVWCKTTEEWLPCCILATIKTSKTSILLWDLMSYNGVGPLITVEGSVTGTKYR